MEKHLTRLAAIPVVLANPPNQTVIAMPQMNLGNTYQMYLALMTLWHMDGDAVKVYTIADADGALSENLRGIREGHHGSHLTRKTIAKHLVYLQQIALLPREGCKFLVVGISRNFGYSPYPKTVETPEKPNKERTRILETPGVDKLNAPLFAETINAVIVYPLPDGSHEARTIILDNLSVDKTATVTVLREAIVAEKHLVTILTQPFHLIVNLLADATIVGKAMIDKKQHLHRRSNLTAKIIHFL
jgi:hypothetical protein